MFGRKKPQVLVVGAGPVGLFSALALAQKGIRVTIVDQDWRTGSHSYALALHSQTMELLAEVGLRDQVLDQSDPIQRIGLYDRTERRREVRLPGPEETKAPVVVMRQDAFESILEKALERFGVPVLWNHAVSGIQMRDDGAVATIEKRVKESVGYAISRTEWIVAKTFDLDVPFVIGADGHNSTVRRSLQIDFPNLSDAKLFAVFEMETDFDFEHEMRIIFEEHSTNVVWPLPNHRCRWSFELTDSIETAVLRTKDRLPAELGSVKFPSLDGDYLGQLLTERAPWFHAPLGKIHWRILIRFERRLANAFSQGCCALAGDAGHLTGPIGMQSMNVGLREAKELTEAIAEAFSGGATADLLQSYSHRRSAEWQGLLGLTGGLKPQDETDRWIHQIRPRLLPCLPASGQDLEDMAQQLGLTTPAFSVDPVTK